MWCVAQAQATRCCSKHPQASGFYTAGNGNVSGGFLFYGNTLSARSSPRRHAGHRAGIHTGGAGGGKRGAAAGTNAQSRACWLPHQVRHDMVGAQPRLHGWPNRKKKAPAPAANAAKFSRKINFPTPFAPGSKQQKKSAAWKSDEKTRGLHQKLGAKPPDFAKKAGVNKS